MICLVWYVLVNLRLWSKKLIRTIWVQRKFIFQWNKKSILNYWDITDYLTKKIVCPKKLHVQKIDTPHQKKNWLGKSWSPKNCWSLTIFVLISFLLKILIKENWYEKVFIQKSLSPILLVQIKLIFFCSKYFVTYIVFFFQK